jgi:hypothetical protein
VHCGISYILHIHWDIPATNKWMEANDIRVYFMIRTFLFWHKIQSDQLGFSTQHIPVFQNSVKSFTLYCAIRGMFVLNIKKLSVSRIYLNLGWPYFLEAKMWHWDGNNGTGVM